MTPEQFLEARLKEDLDQANAVELLSSQVDVIATHSLPEFNEYMIRWQPKRVRADVATKLCIIDDYRSALEWAQSPACGSQFEMSLIAATLHDTLRMLAEAYSDHPDYDESWTL